MKVLNTRLVLTYEILGEKYGSELVLNDNYELNKKELFNAVRKLFTYACEAIDKKEFYKINHTKGGTA